MNKEKRVAKKITQDSKIVQQLEFVRYYLLYQKIYTSEVLKQMNMGLKEKLHALNISRDNLRHFSIQFEIADEYREKTCDYTYLINSIYIDYFVSVFSFFENFLFELYKFIALSSSDNEKKIKYKNIFKELDGKSPKLIRYLKEIQKVYDIKFTNYKLTEIEFLNHIRNIYVHSSGKINPFYREEKKMVEFVHRIYKNKEKVAIRKDSIYPCSLTDYYQHVSNKYDFRCDDYNRDTNAFYKRLKEIDPEGTIKEKCNTISKEELAFYVQTGLFYAYISNNLDLDSFLDFSIQKEIEATCETFKVGYVMQGDYYSLFINEDFCDTVNRALESTIKILLESISKNTELIINIDMPIQ